MGGPGGLELCWNKDELHTFTNHVEHFAIFSSEWKGIYHP